MIKRWIPHIVFIMLPLAALLMIATYKVFDDEKAKIDMNQYDENIPSFDVENTVSGKHKHQKLTFGLDLLKDNFASPEYIDENIIIFSIDSSEKSTSYIFSISRDTKETKLLYETFDGKIINSLVGVENLLYWVEYAREIQNDTPWEIKSFNITKKEVQTFKEGISEDQISPPVLRVFGNKLTWLEYEIGGDVVTSTAMMYDTTSKEMTEIAKAELNESDKDNRDGAFMNIHRPIDNGVIIHQSKFKKMGNENNKSYELHFYPYNKSSSDVVLSNAEGVIDFNADDQWMVICEVGKVLVYDRESQEVIYEIPGDDDRLTLDSPYLIDDKLYFRYSMVQILSLDLSTGEVNAVTEPRATTSKITNSAGFLGFSYINAVDSKNEGEVEFNIIEEGEQ